jgi:SAM-dependent methyltransferase
VSDKATVAYFDEHTPEYDDDRLAHAVKRIKGVAGPEASLCDIGCGVGNILELIGATVRLKSTCGIDVSESCLARTRARAAGAETHCGSVLDADFVAGIGRRFDVVLLAAVLHHLVGRTRRESKRLAHTAVENSLKLLKDGGHLIVVEPTFSPAPAMWLVFWVKKIVTTVTRRRIGIFDRWNNIGAPVVSYLTTAELVALLAAGADCRIDEVHEEECPVNLLMRLALITRKTDTTVVVRKAGPQS